MGGFTPFHVRSIHTMCLQYIHTVSNLSPKAGFLIPYAKRTSHTGLAYSKKLLHWRQ